MSDTKDQNDMLKTIPPQFPSRTIEFELNFIRRCILDNNRE